MTSKAKGQDTTRQRRRRDTIGRRQDRIGEDKARQGKTGEDKTRQDQTGRDKTRQGHVFVRSLTLVVRYNYGHGANSRRHRERVCASIGKKETIDRSDWIKIGYKKDKTKDAKRIKRTIEKTNDRENER
jgi:hypothetical protein